MAQRGCGGMSLWYKPASAHVHTHTAVTGMRVVLLQQQQGKDPVMVAMVKMASCHLLPLFLLILFPRFCSLCYLYLFPFSHHISCFLLILILPFLPSFLRFFLYSFVLPPPLLGPSPILPFMPQWPSYRLQTGLERQAEQATFSASWHV